MKNFKDEYYKEVLERGLGTWDTDEDDDDLREHGILGDQNNYHQIGELQEAVGWSDERLVKYIRHWLGEIAPSHMDERFGVGEDDFPSPQNDFRWDPMSPPKAKQEREFLLRVMSDACRDILLPHLKTIVPIIRRHH